MAAAAMTLTEWDGMRKPESLLASAEQFRLSACSLTGYAGRKPTLLPCLTFHFSMSVIPRQTAQVQ